MTTDNAKLSDAELEELEAHFKKPIRAVDLPLFVVDLLPRLLAMAKDSEHWKRMYECAQNANSFRADAIEKAESISKAAPEGELPDEIEKLIQHEMIEEDWREVVEIHAVRRIARRAYSMAIAKAAPDMVLVPMEPTPEMRVAGYKRYCSVDQRGYSAWQDHLAVYRVMLAAAPKAEE